MWHHCLGQLIHKDPSKGKDSIAKTHKIKGEINRKINIKINRIIKSTRGRKLKIRRRERIKQIGKWKGIALKPKQSGG